MNRALLLPAAVFLLLSTLACGSGDGEDAGKPPKAPASEDPMTPPEWTPPPAIDDAAIRTIDEFIAGAGVVRTRADWRVRLKQPPKLTFTEGKSYFWHLATSQGPIKVKLLTAVAPVHASSTIYLTRLGFYDGLTFHRVIPRFMAQGGCPLGDGTGGPGYEYAGEFSREVTHKKAGLLSMANRGPRTDGSQFFLTFVPTPHLDGKHTIFGEVVGVIDTLEKLERQGTEGQGRPRIRLVLEKATVTVE